MCGIYGWYAFSNKNFDKKILKSLVKSSTRRGKDASGIYIKSNNFEENLVLPVLGTKLLKTKIFKDKIDKKIKLSKILVGHTRLVTNGSVFNNDFNQPLNSKNFIISHNGIIVNSKKLSEKYNVENSDSDSVVFNNVLEKIVLNSNNFENDLSKIFGEIEGTVSAIIYKKNEDKLYLVSNCGSLYFAENESGILIASEKSFLKKLSKDFKRFKISKVDAYNGYSINSKCKINIFKLAKNINDKRGFENVFYTTGLEKNKIDFEKIKKIKRCKKCILPETTPYISFDKKGVCNFCNNYKKIEYIGESELKKIVNKCKSKKGKIDCILAFSGGRDSSYGLHYLVKELKMNPVAVTFDWGMLSDLGRQNQARMLSKLGVEHIVISADINKARNDIKNNLNAWLKKPEIGMLPLLMQGDKTAEYYVDVIKKELGVDLVFFCRGNGLEREEFKSGYCGVKNADPGGVIHNYSLLDKSRLLWFYIKNFIKNPAYINSSLLSSFFGYLVTFVIPHDYIYLWHYIKWDEKKIINTLKNEYNWQGEPENNLTWRVDDGSPAFYNYTYCHIQGFTENDSFRSHQIREGLISRNKALNIIYSENKERYMSMDWYFKTIGINGRKVLSVINKIKKRY